MERAYDKKHMGARIQAARSKKGWSREDFAEKIDLSVNTIADIEQGKNGTRLDNFAKLCNILGLSADYTLFGEEKETAKEISALLRGRDEKTLKIVERTIRAMLDAMDEGGT